MLDSAVAALHQLLNSEPQATYVHSLLGRCYKEPSGHTEPNGRRTASRGNVRAGKRAVLTNHPSDTVLFPHISIAIFTDRLAASADVMTPGIANSVFKTPRSPQKCGFLDARAFTILGCSGQSSNAPPSLIPPNTIHLTKIRDPDKDIAYFRQLVVDVVPTPPLCPVDLAGRRERTVR